MMSDFVQQQHSVCHFNSSDSWVILSPIEQSIKKKIESVGTPLKDWDINIYRGVLTGYNDAFIINAEKRDEILEKCQSEDERKRTANLIRPILRGRDIKRYGYDWAELYLIATFPAKHYNIDLYPAVKNYLLTFAYEYLIENNNDWVANNYLEDFCKQKLSQTGQYVSINGKYVYDLKGNKEKSRKKTSNKWFETQDSISYWEDFSKPKVVYMEIQTDNPKEGYPFPCYSYDDKKCIALNTAYIMSSESTDPRYVLGVLNSLLGKFLVKLYVTQLQERQFRMLAQYVMKFPIVKPSKDQEEDMVRLVQIAMLHKNANVEDQINEMAFRLFKLSELEIDYLLRGK